VGSRSISRRGTVILLPTKSVLRAEFSLDITTLLEVIQILGQRFMRGCGPSGSKAACLGTTLALLIRRRAGIRARSFVASNQHLDQRGLDAPELSAGERKNGVYI